MDRIESEVRDVEARTVLEIVPMIVRRSSVIGHVALVLTLLVAAAGLVALIAARDHFTDAMMFASMIGVFIGAALIAIPLSQIPALQRFATANSDEDLQVRRRASAEFALQRVAATGGRTGLLVFVSVMERRAVVLPDVGVQSVLTAEVCEKLVRAMASHLRAGRWDDAFKTVISEAGLLTAFMPRPAEKRDELGNRLIIKE